MKNILSPKILKKKEYNIQVTLFTTDHKTIDVLQVDLPAENIVNVAKHDRPDSCHKNYCGERKKNSAEYNK